MLIEGRKRGGGTVLNTLKGVEQKRGDGKQRFLKEGQVRQGVGALNRGGLEPPYKLWYITHLKNTQGRFDCLSGGTYSNL